MNTENPIFSLAYTSARATILPSVVKMWNERSSLNSHEWCIGVDADKKDVLEAAQAAAAAYPNIKIIINNGAPTCVAGWNAAAEETKGKIIIAVADDFSPPQDWDKALLDIKPAGWEDGEHVVKVEDGYVHNVFVLAILTRKRYEKFRYIFYPKYLSLFCLPPESEIYMADQSFKRIDQVSVGDFVVGSERRVGRYGKQGQKRDFLCQSRVISITRRRAPIVALTLESGKVLRCTADHAWAYFKGYEDNRDYVKKNGKYVKVDGKYVRTKSDKNGAIAYSRPSVGTKLIRVCDVTVSPPISAQRDLGWLAGIFDGEGCFPVISQSITHNAKVCSEIERVLKKFCFDYSVDDYASGYDHKERIQRTYTITGGRSEYLRFLSTVKPIKNDTVQVKSRMFSSRFMQHDRIISIENAGVSDVICLKTTTGNFVADGYLSHNCDTEFGTVAQRDGVVIDAQHLLFEHMHPDCHKRTRDTVDVKHASKERWNMGEMLYNFRRGIGFPIDDGPMAKIYAERAEAARKEAEQLKKSQPIINKLNSEKYVAYLQVTKDDLCLLDVCKRLMQEGVLDFCFSQPDKYWSGESIAEEHKKEVLDVIKALQVEGAVVHHKIFAVDNYTLPGDTRILIETRVRNDSLSWIRSLGYQHILIVDGDELWVRGTLQIIKAYVEQGHKVISVRMTPVIGLPGYPVEASTDVAVVYVGPGNTFKVCRSPYVAQTVIPRPLIYHFTGTRKGMDETVAKHRRSGHYDDPDYDFEEFIEKVLPNVKPGFKHTWPAGHQGLHFYKNYQIWPSVRQWTEKELEDMPAAVRPYLGSAPV